MAVGLRRVLLVGLVVVLLAVAVSFGWWLRDHSQPLPGQVASATQVVTFQPWTGDGLGNATTESGSCWGSSAASPRSDAYRCSVGNFILDPCFAGAESDRVACPRGNPKDITIVELKEPLPKPFSRTADAEWFLILEDGQECGRLTGTLPPDHVSGAQASGIGCTLGWSYGGINKIDAVWTIKLADDENGQLVTERVRTAYR